ncbi:hypothetical protein J6590_025346 [Homalodisca vitripennis]|nr:hypothetical protein J6590_025346 [Homalodisca vitripennis]
MTATMEEIMKKILVTTIQKQKNLQMKMMNGWNLLEKKMKWATLENLPRQLKLKVKELAGIRDEPRRRAETAAGRCAYCSWRQNRKTKVTCSSCNRYICKEHTTNFCTNCSEDAGDEVEEA